MERISIQKVIKYVKLFIEQYKNVYKLTLIDWLLFMKAVIMRNNEATRFKLANKLVIFKKW